MTEMLWVWLFIFQDFTHSTFFQGRAPHEWKLRSSPERTQSYQMFPLLMLEYIWIQLHRPFREIPLAVVWTRWNTKNSLDIAFCAYPTSKNPAFLFKFPLSVHSTENFFFLTPALLNINRCIMQNSESCLINFVQYNITLTLNWNDVTLPTHAS